MLHNVLYFATVLDTKAARSCNLHEIARERDRFNERFVISGKLRAKLGILRESSRMEDEVLEAYPFRKNIKEIFNDVWNSYKEYSETQ